LNRTLNKAGLTPPSSNGIIINCYAPQLAALPVYFAFLTTVAYRIYQIVLKS